jgi:hypothetical protein
MPSPRLLLQSSLALCSPRLSNFSALSPRVVSPAYASTRSPSTPVIPRPWDTESRLIVPSTREDGLWGKEASSSIGVMRCSRDQLEQSERSMSDPEARQRQRRAYIALGSNIGDRIATIESACHVMHDRGLKVTRTSALYETKAMYMEDQQNFINGACEVCHQVKSRWILCLLANAEA